MTIKTRQIFIVSLIMALLMLISCSKVPKQVVVPIKNNNEKVTLNCVIPSDDVQKRLAFKNFQADVKSTFPGYDIHLSFVKGDTNAYNTKIKVMMYSATPPDIFYSGDENFTEELHSSKSIEPLEKNLENLNFWSMVIPTAKVVGDFGHIYAVPIDEAYYNVMLINTELFSQNNVQIPKSFKELKSVVIKFKEKDIIPIAIGGKDGMSVYKMIESFAGTIDNKVTSKIISGKDTFSGETFTQAAASVSQLIKLDAFSNKIETISVEAAENAFYSSKAAIYCTSSDKLNMAYDKLNGKVAVLYYPSISQTYQSDLNNIVSGGTKKDCGLLVSASTNYPVEATKLAVQMSKYYNKYLYEKQGHDAVIYNLNNMEWDPSRVSDSRIKELIMNIKQEGKVNTGLFEYNISSNKQKSIKDDSVAFMTGILPVSDYLKEMDISMKLK